MKILFAYLSAHLLIQLLSYSRMCIELLFAQCAITVIIHDCCDCVISLTHHRDRRDTGSFLDAIVLSLLVSNYSNNVALFLD